MACYNCLEVGIFSRDNPTCYECLIDVIKSAWGVKTVHSIPITNSMNDFEKWVRRCSLAILYHSKTRGRINVTDVTDSLYDMELKYLYTTLGKEKVIVVIDHLENRNEKEKTRILNNQPSIHNLASHLFLFNGNEETEGAKVKKFINLITRHAFRALILRFTIWLTFFFVVLFIVIIIVSVKYSKLPEIENETSTPEMPNITWPSTPNTTPQSSAPVLDNVTSQAINTTG
ncbi:uncharacterized protein RB166_015473 [Leptodactylus fuscus]|uniref:uncharacterized protein LOC142216427 n=1 Tax=Leptodactylus fuscus TaxID=238119 RepID=UPI003F4E6E88